MADLENWETMKKKLEEGGMSSPLPQQIRGKIIAVSTKTRGEVFGEHVIFDATKKSLEQAQAEPLIQVEVDTGYEITVRESFSPFITDKSKLGQFKAFYHTLPDVGMEVQLVRRPGKDGRHYYRILY